MPKNPKTLAEQFFGRTEAIKDYLNAINLYGRYKEAEQKGVSTDKLKPELIDAVNSAYEGCERLYNIYKGAYEDMQRIQSQDKSLYSPSERTGYFEEIKRIFEDITTIKNELGIEKKPKISYDEYMKLNKKGG